MSRSLRMLNQLSKKWNFRTLEMASHIAGIKAFKDRIPWFSEKGLNISCLPINEDIEAPEGVVLPVQLLYDFIERASHRVKVDFCPCRRAMECKRYPVETGCLMMGRAALEIHPTVGREVGVEEAKEHARQAISRGLVPFVGKARVDNIVFGIRNKKQLLSVCFCCECCCISRYARHVPARLRADNVRRLEGLTVTVGEECDACGACVKKCFLQEIEIVDGRAVIGEGCAGCGRCATVCKRDAITLSLENPDFMEAARSRIEELVDIS